MTQTLTKQEFSFYSLLYLKFSDKEFDLNSVRWYFSRPMLKKLVFGLVKAGWIKQKRKGVYECVTVQKTIARLFDPEVEKVLQESKLTYCFTKATAAEIWSDETYIQRSWEYNPFFVKVLKNDLKKWENFLGLKKTNYFVNIPNNIVGEFVVLFPVNSIKIHIHNGKPVDSLKETINFCEKNKDSFEYVLAYLQNKHKQKTTASKELLIKTREAL